MRKILIFIGVSIASVIAFSSYIVSKFGFEKGDAIAILGYFSIFSSAILLYFSLDVNLKYNQRKAAMDLLHERMKKEILPVYNELKGLIQKDFFLESSEKSFQEYVDQEKNEEKKGKAKALTDEILAFYERLALGILKEVYDEDICFDDSAFEVIHFYDWTKTYLKSFQERYNKRRFVNFSHLADVWRERYEKQEERLKRKSDVRKETVANKKI